MLKRYVVPWKRNRGTWVNKGERKRPQRRDPDAVGMGDGETFQTEGAKGVAKWKEGIWRIQKPPEREDTQGGQAGSTRKLKGFTGARLYELYTMEENINRFVSFNF